jgi:hypothetical protein
VREAERAWFLSEGEESEALIRVGFDTLGQKQRVFLPCSLSLSSTVAAAISQNLSPEHSNQLSPKWRCLHKESNVCIFFKLELKEMSNAET